MTEPSKVGVFVEEIPAPAKPIERVDIGTAGFVGPTRKGPRSHAPRLITSLAEFERIHGGPQALRCGHNYLWFAVRAFFEEGGRRVYIARTPTGEGSNPATLASYRSALQALENLDDISMIAAPGHSAYPNYPDISEALIEHAERLANRIAVLDTPEGKNVAEVEQIREGIDSSYAALYYPWLVVNPPAPGQPRARDVEVTVPPSGFICGLYARSPPPHAHPHEVVRGALRAQTDITEAQLQSLVQQGVNCVRHVAARGLLVWGARTATSDPDYKYVPVRRYLIFLEASIQRGLQWAVFEPNGEQLWSRVRSTVSDFLFSQWRDGALLGENAQQAFFVRCDRTTMTQDDIDNGRLICLVGVGILKPAEFVIVRIGQWTADHCGG